VVFEWRDNRDHGWKGCCFPMKISAFIVAVLLVLLGGLTAASLYFYNFAIKRGQKEFLRDNRDLQATFSQRNESRGPTPAQWVQSRPWEIWQIRSRDELKLVAHYLPAPYPTGKTAILAHGYTGKGKDMGRFARFYHEELGFNVLMPDARGHGESEGDYIGFGWHERLDYLQWIGEVLAKVGEEAQIVLHGLSMGAATVLMVSGEELPGQVKAIVADCGYTSVYDQLAYQLRRLFRLPTFPLLDTTSLVTKLKAGYSFREASALEQVKKGKVPLLLIHGAEDRFVPTEMACELYAACPGEKEIFIVEGAGHGTAYTTAGEDYEARVVGFLGRYMVL
jgi:fermentation-respiration switch protein FrsA (DUF1100 family)